MRAVYSWLSELVPGLPDPASCADALTAAGLKVESVDVLGAGESAINDVVVGKVESIEELTGFKKPIRFVRVRVTEDGPLREIVCGATNFAVGDRVPVALPGAMLPGGVAIGVRETYGRVSDGMICSARELGMGDDHRGIMVLPADTPLGADVAALFGWPDAMLEIEVTTDRGYALAHRGLARELATAFGLAFTDPADVALPSVAGPSVSVRIDDLSGCSHYVLRTLRGLTASPSPLTWQARLIAAGMRPISRIVDVTNLSLLGLGQPLHAFDAEKLQGGIVVRRATAGELLTTLDGVERTLDAEDLVIADDLGPVALAGVMGGARTEISETTNEVALESAHFDATTVTRTVRRHGLASEASRRFERGVDPGLSRYAAEIAASMIRGGSSEPEVLLTEVGAAAPLPTVLLPAGECERLGGRVYPIETIRQRLVDVGCTSEGSDPLIVQPPSWRPDLTRAADLVEEVLRLEGYQSIPVTLPRAPAGRGLTVAQRSKRRATAALSDAGYVEVLLLPFVAGDVADRLGLVVDDPRRNCIRVANPLSEDEAYLRTSLLPGLLGAAARNVGRGLADVALFEIGTVFLANPQSGEPPAVPPVDRRPARAELAAIEASLPIQPTHVAAILAGQRIPSGPLQAARAADWADAIAAAHTLASSVGAVLTITSAATEPWHPGRCAQVSVSTPSGPRVIGYAGELHPRVVADAGLPARTCAIELNLGDLLDAAEPPPVLPPLSPQPAADRDVALLVAHGVEAAVVEAALRTGAGSDLESVRLFDDFSTADGQRSLAYRLRWRADRTLTAEEVNARRDSAVALAAELTGARQRV